MHNEPNADAEARQSTAGAAGGSTGAAAEQAVSALASALSSAVADARQERTTARTADTNKTDTFESKTSDVMGEEVAQLNNLAQQAIGFGNNKTVADVGAALLFDRALNANPFFAQGIVNLQNQAQAWNAFMLATAQDNQTAKHFANLDLVKRPDDLIDRATLRDESSIARGQQRDQDAIATVLIERLRSDEDFKTAFVALLIEALKKTS